MSDSKAAGPLVQKLEKGAYFWCGCGQSGQSPFCDGQHKGSGKSPLRFELEEDKTCAVCTCGQTASPPFCDGAHSQL